MFEALKAVFRKIYFKVNKNKVLINGRWVKIPADLISFFSIRTNNVVETELEHFLNRYLKEGDVFIDVGASIGLVSLFASNQVGAEGKVIAFEPNPWVYNRLSDIVRLNNKKNIKTYELAISDTSGWLSLNLNNADSILMTRSSMLFADQNAQHTEVLVSSLDTFIPSQTNIDILKVDVEGVELEVLRGSRRLIEKQQPLVCVEIHGLFFDDHEKHVNEIFSFFDNMNYSCYNLYKKKEENNKSFIENTGFQGTDEISGKDLSRHGYGQVVFFPKSKKIEF
ncbi:MAG: FkbM family methyltransferase [Fulvivirga sp.]|nr:FkbM family methyltransferase [Fulvivirga sp.]